MRQIGWFVVCVLALGSAALARLGESPARCAARYGKEASREIGEGGLVLIKYSAGPMATLVSFENNKAVGLDYMKLDRQGEVSSFSRDEIVELLSAHGPERNWKFDRSAGNLQFSNERDNVGAVTGPERKGLSVWLQPFPPPETARDRWRPLKDLE